MPFVIAFAVGLVLTPVAVRVGRAWGPMDRPSSDALKIHSRPIPLLGGIAVVTATLAAVTLVGLWVSPWFVAAVGLCLIAGTIDDVRSLSPLVRLTLQAAAGALLAASIPLGDLEAVGVIGTIVLVLLCTNAVNLVDGQDGLAGGLAAISALGLAILGSNAGDGSTFIVGLALTGALVPFLLWNRPPARIFLGNGGAYGVGAILAALAASVTVTLGWQGLMASGLCLFPFAFELCFTVARRLASRRALASGDRNHIYDLVSRRWGSRVRVMLGAWILGGAMVGLAILLVSIPLVGAIIVSVAVAGASLAVGVALWRGERSGLRRSRSDTGPEHQPAP